MRALQEQWPAKTGLITLVIVGCLGTAEASAQSAAPGAQSPESAATAGSGTLEEIVVTARLRTENLQDVPISAEVIGAQTLDQRNLNSLDDVSETVPSVHIGDNGRSANLYIRGVGSGENQAFDQSVGTFIDDIYHGRARTSAATFLDLDRVEVLKGPQSTFFGNNAIAGAFNIVTKKPGDTFDASGRLLYGQFGQYVAEGAAGGPITDSFGVRVAVIANGDSGWIDNVNIGEHVPRENDSAARVTFLFKPIEDLEATLKIEGSKDRNTGGLALQGNDCPPAAPFVAAGFCQLALQLGVPRGIGNNAISQNAGQRIELSADEDVLTINYSHWGQTFTWVSGFYGYHYDTRLDLDATPLTLLNIEAPERYNQFSQEFRVASALGQPLEYLAGVYFQTDDLFFRQDLNYSFLTPVIESIPPFAPLDPYLPLGEDTNYSQQEHSYAAFGALTWNVTDRLKLTAGLRGTQVDKSYHWNLYYGTAAQDYGDIVPLPAALAPIPGFLGLGTPNTLSGNRSDHSLLPSAQIQYQLEPQVMIYGSYARGFKAGGFNGADTTGVAANLPFAPEHVDAFELGLKGEWFERLQVNLALFHSEYKDLQVSFNELNSAGAVTSIVNNAAASLSQGVELDAQWAASAAFHLSAHAAYLDSYYKNYSNVSLTQLQAFCRASYVLPGCSALLSPVPEFQDLSGRPTEFAPKWTGSLTADYRVVLPAGYKLTTELTGIFTTSYFMSGSDDPTVAQSGYARLDARMTLETSNGHWSFDVIGKNLTDRDIASFSFPWSASAGSTFVQKEQPRNFAIQARFHW